MPIRVTAACRQKQTSRRALVRDRGGGTLGVLLRAKQEGVVTTISPMIDTLEERGFRIYPSTRAAVLRLAGE